MKSLPLDWRNIVLLGVVHVVALGGLALYLPFHGLTVGAAVIGVTLTSATIFSISAGYHRLFSHRSYEASPLLRFLLLAIGAGAFQNSALAWAVDHRRHHAKTDTASDPYSAGRGFWHAHIGWVLRRADPDVEPLPVRDLERDPLVRWQKRHYALIGVASGVALPVALGLLVGDVWGGFVLGGAVRLLVVYHATFSINSFAHMLGTQPYSGDNSARDSFVTALISMGEGYHNYHHSFPSDYRNGVRPYQFDPTKWVLAVLAVVRLAVNLRRAPEWAVLHARLRMDARSLPRVSVANRDRLIRLRHAIELGLDRCRLIQQQYATLRRQGTTRADSTMSALRARRNVLRRAAFTDYAEWRRVLRCSGMVQR